MCAMICAAQHNRNNAVEAVLPGDRCPQRQEQPNFLYSSSVPRFGALGMNPEGACLFGSDWKQVTAVANLLYTSVSLWRPRTTSTDRDT